MHGIRIDSLRRAVLAACQLCVVWSVCDAHPPASPAEQYHALRQQYDRAASSGAPLTDTERLAFVGRVYKARSELAVKFLKLAEAHPDDPIALDALVQAVWQVNTVPWPVELVGGDPARARSFELIVRDHIDSERLAPLCLRVGNGFCQEYESFLRAVLASNRHAHVRGAACLALGHLLYHRQQRIALCKEQPDLAEQFARLYGKEYIAELMRQDPQAVLKEAEGLLAQAAAEFAAVELPDGTNLGERARREFFELQHLRAGAPAPEIEGIDQHGTAFKLSDYRGKVVLLDFWSHV